MKTKSSVGEQMSLICSYIMQADLYQLGFLAVSAGIFLIQ